MTLSITVKTDPARKRLTRHEKNLKIEIPKALRQIGVVWEEKFKRTQFRPYRDRPYQNALRNRERALYRSAKFRLTNRGIASSVRLSVGEGLPYAHVQEFGAKIFGKPWLKIPLPAALTPSGRLREFVQFRKDKSGFVNSRGERSFIVNSPFRGGDPTKALVIAISRGRGSRKRIIPLFVLKRSVTIPAGRLGFRRTIRKLKPTFLRIIKRALKAANK